jgi:hypothetical protein
VKQLKRICELCGDLHLPAKAVTVDGKEVCTYSESWRHECEIRYAMQLPDKARKPKITKLDYLVLVEKERGEPARKRLRTEMAERYNRGR